MILDSQTGLKLRILQSIHYMGNPKLIIGRSVSDPKYFVHR